MSLSEGDFARPQFIRRFERLFFMARPSSYTQDIADAICERLVCGKDDLPESLRSICSDEGMPDLKTVMRWLKNKDEFRQQYAHAREMQAEAHYEELIEIADDCTDDVMFLTADDESGESGRPVIKHSAIARARLRIDTRKWAMSKMAPKKYGDKLALGGADDLPPVKTESTVTLEPGEAYRRMLDGK